MPRRGFGRPTVKHDIARDGTLRSATVSCRRGPPNCTVYAPPDLVDVSLVEKMDKTERIAHDHLRHRGIDQQEIQFEPDGRVPPDFLLHGRVAVEVRRLNQNERTAGGHRGITDIPTWQSLEPFMRTIGPSGTDESWFVGVTILRSPARPKAMKKSVGSKLTAFCQSPFRQNQDTYRFDVDSLRLKLWRADGVHPSFLVPGGLSDRRAGGFILSEMIRNIPICIEEKSRKTEPYRRRYSVWWLILVDHIHGHLDTDEKQELQSAIQIPYGWDRVIIVNRTDPRRAVELHPAENNPLQQQPD